MFTCSSHRLLFALLITCFSARAQYLPFIESGKTWRELVETSSGVWFLDEYQLTGDTLINTFSYKKLEMVSSTDSGIMLPYYSGAIREDTTARTVYMIFPGDSVEFLLYDFDLEVGEQHTFHYCYNSEFPGSIPGIFTVDSIGNYTDENGLNRKTWYLNYQHVGIVTRIVEGVGSNSGIFSYSCFFDFWCDLICVHQDSSLLFINELPFANYCVPFISVGLDEQQTNDADWTVYPNPATNVVRVEFETNMVAAGATVTAVDQMGRSVQLYPVVQSNTLLIDISGLPNGLYYLSIQADHKYLVRKIVVEGN